MVELRGGKKYMQIKTITTVDGVNTVEFDESSCKFYWIKNIGNTTVYASANATVEADADNVVVITAGNAAMIETHRNTVYVLGAGKVEIHEQDIPDCFFKSAAQGGGGEGSAVSYSPTVTSGVKIGELTIDGTVNNLYSNVFYGVCTTATNTNAKTVTIEGYAAANLTEGTVIVVKFTNAAHAAQAQTLNVNDTGAKSIVKYGSTSAAGAWVANQVVILVYDGTYWRIADYQQNTDANVLQSPNTNVNAEIPVLFKGDTTTQAKTEGVSFNSNITVNPSTGTLTATKFVGDGSGLTNLPTSGSEHNWYGVCDSSLTTYNKVVTIDGFTSTNLVAGTTIKIKFLHSAPIANYAVTLNVSNTRDVPVYTSGAGNPTNAWLSNQIVTFTYDGSSWLQNDYQADTKVTQALSTSSNFVPVIIKNTTSTTTTTGNVYFTNKVLISPTEGYLSAVRFLGDGSQLTNLTTVVAEGNCDNTTPISLGTFGTYREYVVTLYMTDINNRCWSNTLVIPCPTTTPTRGGTIQDYGIRLFDATTNLGYMEYSFMLDSIETYELVLLPESTLTSCKYRIVGVK